MHWRGFLDLIVEGPLPLSATQATGVSDIRHIDRGSEEGDRSFSVGTATHQTAMRSRRGPRSRESGRAELVAGLRVERLEESDARIRAIHVALGVIGRNSRVSVGAWERTVWLVISCA